jgi:twitching motility two-component system response regulator PilG
MLERTSLLQVHSQNNEKGFIYLNHGVLFDAFCGEKKGEAAAKEMLGWDDANIEFKNPPVKRIKRCITKGLKDLIQDVLPSEDESSEIQQEGVPELRDSAVEQAIDDLLRTGVEDLPVTDGSREGGVIFDTGVDADTSEILNLMEPLASDEPIEQEPESFSPIPSNSGELLAEALELAEGNHFQRAAEAFSELLRENSESCEGWLWYSRVLRNIKDIESALEKAAGISPDDPEVVEETRKIILAKSRVSAEQVLRCPFCWSPLEVKTVECQYCKSHLFIHKAFFTSVRAGRQDVLEKAIERYTRVTHRETNINAHYYLGMAHLNLEHWEVGLDHLNELDRLAPKSKVRTEQLQSLLNYMAAMETLAHQEVFTRENGLEPALETEKEVQRNKVLVVEDSATTRKVVSITLGKQGYTVLEAQNGLEALTKLNDEKPDLVLLDIILPGMDGYKILSIIRDSAELKHIPVIMLTSKDKFLDKVKGKMSGSNEYLTKPFNPDQLVAKVSKYLH